MNAKLKIIPPVGSVHEERVLEVHSTSFVVLRSSSVTARTALAIRDAVKLPLVILGERDRMELVEIEGGESGAAGPWIPVSDARKPAPFVSVLVRIEGDPKGWAMGYCDGVRWFAGLCEHEPRVTHWAEVRSL